MELTDEDRLHVLFAALSDGDLVTFLGCCADDMSLTARGTSAAGRRSFPSERSSTGTNRWRPWRVAPWKRRCPWFYRANARTWCCCGTASNGTSGCARTKRRTSAPSEPDAWLPGSPIRWISRSTPRPGASARCPNASRHRRPEGELSDKRLPKPGPGVVRLDRGAGLLMTAVRVTFETAPGPRFLSERPQQPKTAAGRDRA